MRDGERKAGMFEDLLRDLGIGQNNSGVSCGDGSERPAGRAFIRQTRRQVLHCRPCNRPRRPIMSEWWPGRSWHFQSWRLVPPPRRGEVVRQVGEPCARERPNLACWSRSRPARSAARVRGKFRK